MSMTENLDAVDMNSPAFAIIGKSVGIKDVANLISNKTRESFEAARKAIIELLKKPSSYMSEIEGYFSDIDFDDGGYDSTKGLEVGEDSFYLWHEWKGKKSREWRNSRTKLGCPGYEFAIYLLYNHGPREYESIARLPDGYTNYDSDGSDGDEDWSHSDYDGEC